MHGKPDNALTEAFKTNIKDLLSTLEKQAPFNNGFFNYTSGENSDKLCGLVQCRGDLPAEVCAACLKGLVRLVFEECPNNYVALIQSMRCLLSYSVKDFFGQLQTNVTAVFTNR